jgi:cell division protein FtsW (lipid II flippase)
VIQGWLPAVGGSPQAWARQPGLIPAADTDFIFGYRRGAWPAGGSLILVAFVLMVPAAHALTTDREVRQVAGGGLTTLLGIQAFVIIGGHPCCR